MKRIALSCLFVLYAATLLWAQEPAQETPAGQSPRSGFTPPSQEPQPYEKVITKDAVSKTGVFTVHKVKDKYYYEIPPAQLNKEFLGSLKSPKPRWASATAGRRWAIASFTGNATATRFIFAASITR